MALIDNDDALAEVIAEDLRKIVQEIADEIVEMIKESVLTIVYEPYEPSMYERQKENGGFYDSWTNDNLVINKIMNGASISTNIFSDALKMAYSPSQYIHGSNEGGDRREIMDAAIAEGTNYDFDSEIGEGWWQEPRDYWAPVIDMLGARHRFQILFEQKMRDRGISFKRV